MPKSAGPILATGLISTVNRTVFNHDDMDWRILPATALAAVGFSLFERVWAQGAVILSWTVLATILLTRIDGQTAPVENALNWWNTEGK